MDAPFSRPLATFLKPPSLPPLGASPLPLLPLPSAPGTSGVPGISERPPPPTTPLPFTTTLAALTVILPILPGKPGKPVPLLPIPPAPLPAKPARESAAFLLRETILYNPATKAPPASREPTPSRALNFLYSWLTTFSDSLPTSEMSRPSSRLFFSRSTSFFKPVTKPRRPDAGPPPPVPWPPSMIVCCKLSQALPKAVISPARLSFLTSFIFLAMPSAESTALASLAKFSSDSFIIARKPLMASCPAIEAADCAFCSSVMPLNLERRSNKVCLKGLMEPSAFAALIPIASRALAASDGGFTNLVRVERKAVPASLPLIPALAIKPMARDVSSMLNFIAPAIGATYLKVSPIIDTLVFDLEVAAAKTSAKCPDCSAFRPKADKASVTISDTRAKLSPEAPARFIMPLIPDNICWSLQPAIAMYSIA